MSRRLRINAQPPHINPVFDQWARQVTDALNFMPGFSISSTTNGPNSVVTGNSGEFLIDIGSSATTFWLKRHSDGSTSGWSAIGFA
jgi:hypothetical protein